MSRVGRARVALGPRATEDVTLGVAAAVAVASPQMFRLRLRLLSSCSLVWLAAAPACGDDSGGDDGNASVGSSGAMTSGLTSSSGTTPGSDTSADPSTDGSTDAGPGSTSGNDSSDGGMATDSGGSSGGSDTGGGSSSGGQAAITYADIQAELENAGQMFGNYESCTDGASCHQNPARNVHIVPNPDPAQLMTNWSNIVDVPQGVVPWVTPADDTAQMLNEVPIPADVRARWLAWIQDGAPFE